MKGGSSEELIHKLMRFLTVNVRKLESSRVEKGISNPLAFLTTQPGQVRVIRNFFFEVIDQQIMDASGPAQQPFLPDHPGRPLSSMPTCAELNAGASRRYCTG